MGLGIGKKKCGKKWKEEEMKFVDEKMGEDMINVGEEIKCGILEKLRMGSGEEEEEMVEKDDKIEFRVVKEENGGSYEEEGKEMDNDEGFEVRIEELIEMNEVKGG